MDINDFKQLSTCAWLWRYVGIVNQADVGLLRAYLLCKIRDFGRWCLSWVGLYPERPPLIGESIESFYVRNIYGTSYDIFTIPIMGPPEHHITIGLRKEVPIEYTTQLVLCGKTRECINFGSYNYLGFGGRHPIVTKEVVEALKRSGSAITGFAGEKGISKEQRELENYLAEFLHKDAAVVVPMGFATNSTLIPILVGKGDVVFSDALNHSSIITGVRSSNAEVKVFKHNDMIDLKNKLEELKVKGMKDGSQPKKVMVIVEGLYSMEGEFCPLRELIALKKIYGFYLYVDEAHSIGAMGKTGRGITEHLGCNFDDVDILMGTFSKSFGAAGGYIASDKKTIELLKSNCYSYVYGAPMSPVVAQQIISSLNMMKTEEGERRINQLRKSSVNFRRRLIEAGCHVLGDTESPVIPVLIYHPGKIRDVARQCLKRGVAVVGVSAPAVPTNASRIRFCVSAAHTDEDMDKTFNSFMEVMRVVDCVFGDTPMPSVIYHPPKIDMAELEQMKQEPRKMEPLWANSDNRPILEEPLEPIGVDMTNFDIYDLTHDNERTESLSEIIRQFGCGACGPRQFYGSTIEHLELERKLQEFFGTTCSLAYSYGNNVMTSVVPLYGAQGDVLIIDEKCNYSIQLGARLAKKATVVTFKHNDVADLKAKVDQYKQTTKFPNKIAIVTEGVFQHDLSIAPLDEISKLRDKDVLMVVDDSLGFGVLGKTLKGTLEHFGLTNNDCDVYCGSLEFVGHSIGGFVVGKYGLVNTQKLFSLGFMFSAAPPTYSTTAGRLFLEQLEKSGEAMALNMRERKAKFQRLFKEKITEKKNNIQLIGNEELPFMLMNCEGKNEALAKHLRSKGFSVCIQQHLQEDWCQTKYIKLCIGKPMEEKMEEFVAALAEF